MLFFIWSRRGLPSSLRAAPTPPRYSYTHGSRALRSSSACSSKRSSRRGRRRTLLSRRSRSLLSSCTRMTRASAFCSALVSRSSCCLPLISFWSTRALLSFLLLSRHRSHAHAALSSFYLLFIIFSSSTLVSLRTDVATCRYASTPGTKDERLDAIKRKWSELTPQEAQRYHNLAETDRGRYKRDVLQYRAIILKHQLVAFYQRYDPQKLREVDLGRIAQHFAPQPAQLDHHLRQVR